MIILFMIIKNEVYMELDLLMRIYYKMTVYHDLVKLSVPPNIAKTGL